MANPDNIETFFEENKKLMREYVMTKLEFFKLKFISYFSKSAGLIIWFIISIFLVFLFMVFLGLFTGFWLSNLTGSYTSGFGLTALIMLGVIITMALLRKPLFINPLMRSMIKHLSVTKTTEQQNN